MSCPLCRKRSARRACPALQRQICAVCCGTKRVVDIRCPPTCPHLVTAKSHPPAVERRQQVRDFQVLAPMVRDLTEAQQRLLTVVFGFLTRWRGEGLIRLGDADVAEGLGAMAATVETAARGVIYEHQPASLAAQRLASELRAVLAELAKGGWRSLDKDAAIVLRRVETAALDAPKALGAGDTAFLDLVARASRSAGESSPGPESGRRAPLVVG